MLIGEIRDHETATIAIEAALTGHLVLSTLHTNDASTAPMRLVEMGVEPFLVASTVGCIVAQRLARKLCVGLSRGSVCGSARNGPGRVWRSTARGRPCVHREAVPPADSPATTAEFGLHEVLVMNESLRGHVLSRSSTEEILKQAKIDGMATLREDGASARSSQGGQPLKK